MYNDESGDVMEHSFIKEWKKENYKILHRMYPEVSKKEINKFLDKEVKKYLKNPDCEIDNNYIGKTIKTNLLSVIDWIKDTKPICAGHGVFFKNQHEVISPLAIMIQKFLTSRKAFKKRLKDFDPTSYEYATFDRKQLAEKVNANAIYGASGNVVSFLFNMYTAASVTGSGQSLISTTEQAFEGFLSNNVIFNSINECYTFLNNILSEKYEMNMSFLRNVDHDKLIKRLSDMFYRVTNDDINSITEFVYNLSQEEINKIYYKNNLYEFSIHPEILALLTNIVRYTEEFKDPNEIPEESEVYLSKLWSYYKQFVLYNHSPINRIQRLKNDTRKTVLTIDTDSNFLHLDPWVHFMYNNVIKDDYRCADKDIDTLKFISVNTMAFCITNMMKEVLGKYTADVNIPKDYRHFINIKNEFLMSRVILASKKKRYITSIRLREGSEIWPEKLDTKGMDYMKSTTPENVKARFESIIKTRLLESKEINPALIIQDLAKFEKEIIDSLKNGEKEYLIPKSVKELEAYADPFKEQGVRAIAAWNYIYPDQEIRLPAKVDLVKLLLTDEMDLEKLKNVNREVYEIVKENIFNNPNEKIANKGLAVLAVPRNIEKLPEWTVPFIDYDTVTYNILKKFYPVLESVNLETIKTSGKEYYSNILNI